MALGENIRAWRERKGWSTHDLALESDINQSSISRFEQNKTRPRPETLRKIAEALGAEIPQLEYGTADLDVIPVGKRRIPVLDYTQVGNWIDVNEDDSGPENGEFVLTNAKWSDEAFALIVRDDSMLPVFLVDDTITVDPDIAPRPGRFVVAVNGVGEASLKKFADLGVNAKGEPLYELRPLNPDYPIWNSETTPFRIVGSIVEVTRVLVRSK